MGRCGVALACKGVSFNVFCYNVQPMIEIDYATGDNWLAEGEAVSSTNTSAIKTSTADEPKGTYVLNANTKKFHDPSCKSVSKMKAKNKSEFKGTRSEVIAKGYSPCGNCSPQKKPAAPAGRRRRLLPYFKIVQHKAYFFSTQLGFSL